MKKTPMMKIVVVVVIMALMIVITTGSWSFGGLTLWRRVTHICVSKQTLIGSDNGLSPDRRQAIIWTNAGYC